MMKKTAVLLMGAASIIAVPAQAREGRVYAGINGGIVFEDQAEVENEPFTGQPPALINTGTGWEVDAVIGYDFGRFRLELEGGYKNQDHDTLIITGPNASNLPVGLRTGPDSTQRIYSGMLNALVDIGPDDGLQFYAGGGAGVAHVDFNLSTPDRGTFINDSDTTFAWQGIAGVRYPLTNNIDVGLKYRYFRVENVNVNGFNDSPLEVRLESHSALASLMVNFGGGRQPAPAPAAAPPPPPPPPPPPQQAAPPPPPQTACNTGPYIVFFEFDRSDLTPEASGILNNAVTAYANCGNARVMLAGHTDRAGSAQYNMALAERRNNSVRSYMTGRGIPAGQISSQAFGESQPRVPTADGVREPQNRRVEITYGPGSGR
jgi:OmpA-OmpF porin, OOP family